MRFLFLPRLAKAIPPIPDRLLLRSFREEMPVSAYFTASTGETFAAIRPGRPQESSTVATANSADAAKIRGELLTSVCIVSRLVLARTTGTRQDPTSQPAISPSGQPTPHSRRACCRMIRRSCLGVTPMVFRRP